MYAHRSMVNDIKLQVESSEMMANIFSNLEAKTSEKDILDAWLRDNAKKV